MQWRWGLLDLEASWVARVGSGSRALPARLLHHHPSTHPPASTPPSFHQACKAVREPALVALVACCPQLQELDLQYCPVRLWVVGGRDGSGWVPLETCGPCVQWRMLLGSLAALHPANSFLVLARWPADSCLPSFSIPSWFAAGDTRGGRNAAQRLPLPADSTCHTDTSRHALRRCSPQMLALA